MIRFKYLFKFIVLTFILQFIFSCTKWRNEDISTSTSLSIIAECTSNSATVSDEECVAKAGKYVYDSQYGGRSTEQTDQTGANGALSVFLPDGWYSGKTASATDSDLQSSNIVDTYSFFGTSGSLTGGAFGACTVDTGIAAPSSCTLGSGNYVYTTAYGGRSLSCSTSTLPSTVTAACWLSGAGWYLNGSASVNCSTEGLQSSKCRISSSKYWSAFPYGGRSATCTLPGINATACWTNASGVYVLDATCTDESYNGGACVTAGSRYVYTSEYGGRNVDCTSNNAGSCYFSAAKNVVEANLIATNIKSGNTIFGVAGSYGGTNTDWGSGMNRDATETKLTLADEAVTYAGINSTLPAGYRPVPNINLDTEGGSLNGSPQITKVDRTGWATQTCGLAGSQSARISDCAVTFGGSATWTGATAGVSGHGSWQLVSRSGAVSSGRGQEVWKDNTTGLLWSSLISTNLNWCKAIGHNNSANVDIVAQALNEDDPSDICDQVFYQNQIIGVDVVSGCSEYVGTTTTDSDIFNVGKSNLNRASTPSTLWRAPSIYDYMIANQNGLRFVLPDMQDASQGDEWTATIYSGDRAQAWTFSGSTGQRKIQNRNFSSSMRCVGR